MVIALLLRTIVVIAVWLTKVNLLFNTKIKANTHADEEEKLSTFLVKESCSQQFPQSSEKQKKLRWQHHSIKPSMVLIWELALWLALPAPLMVDAFEFNTRLMYKNTGPSWGTWYIVCLPYVHIIAIIQWWFCQVLDSPISLKGYGLFTCMIYKILFISQSYRKFSKLLPFQINFPLHI